MYCQKCGAENDSNAYRCIKCGEVIQSEIVNVQVTTEPKPRVPNYLAQSIIVTLLCCLPVGIPAIVYAAQVNGYLVAGNIDAALNSSKNAKMWCWVSFWCGLIPLLIWLLIFGIGIIVSIVSAH